MFKSKSSKLLERRQQHQLQLQRYRQQQQQQQQQVSQFENNQCYLSECCHRTYSCIHCRAQLADHDDLLSKLFQGHRGRAYLFNKVVNVRCKQAVQRQLMTGLHAVADIYCDGCDTTLGWKYEQAFEPSQKYKEGKYIIEVAHLLKENNWDLNSYNSEQLLGTDSNIGNQEHQKKKKKEKEKNTMKREPGNYSSNSNEDSDTDTDLTTAGANHDSSFIRRRTSRFLAN